MNSVRERIIGVISVAYGLVLTSVLVSSIGGRPWQSGDYASLVAHLVFVMLGAVAVTTSRWAIRALRVYAVTRLGWLLLVPVVVFWLTREIPWPRPALSLRSLGIIAEYLVVAIIITFARSDTDMVPENPANAT